LQITQVPVWRTLGKIQNLDPDNLIVGVKIQEQAGRYLFRFNNPVFFDDGKLSVKIYFPELEEPLTEN
jgi:hypothetical protein